MNRRRWWPGGVLAVVLAGWMGGCESSDIATDNTPVSFRLESDLASYSEVDNYWWDTTLEQAVVTVEVDHFTHGDVTLRVFDSRGEVIFRRVWATPYNTIYVNEDDFIATGQTDRGQAGQWRIELSFDQFTGDLDLQLK